MMPFTIDQVDGKEGWKLLFGSDQAWPAWMNAVRVVSIASDWFGTSKFPPDTVMRSAAARLNRTGVAFATTSLAQSWVHEPACGQGVESYTDPPGNLRVAQALRGDGFTLAYVVMDEPLWYGHYYSGPNACHSSIANTAERAAAIMREYLQVFPQVLIGENEPTSLVTMPGWRGAYRAWQRAFQDAVGKPISFLRADIQWNDPQWRGHLGEMVDFAQGEQVDAGIIYNGNLPPGTSYTPPAQGTQTTPAEEAANRLWLHRAARNFMDIEQRDGLAPDQAVFESWGTLPLRTVSVRPTGTSPEERLGENYLIQTYLSMHRR